jgi:hypothetical protein
MKHKTLAAVELGRKRWRGVSAGERKRFSEAANAARAAKRREQMEAIREQISAAHIPSWLRIRLLEAADTDDTSDAWVDVGYQLGRHHLEDFCANLNRAHRVREGEVVSQPTRVLRRIFASEDHPRGELTDLIGRKYRLAFLLGLLAGAKEHERGEGWLRVAEGLGLLHEDEGERTRATQRGSRRGG